MIFSLESTAETLKSISHEPFFQHRISQSLESRKNSTFPCTHTDLCSFQRVKSFLLDILFNISLFITIQFSMTSVPNKFWGLEETFVPILACKPTSLPAWDIFNFSVEFCLELKTDCNWQLFSIWLENQTLISSGPIKWAIQENSDEALWEI